MKTGQNVMDALRPFLPVSNSRTVTVNNPQDLIRLVQSTIPEGEQVRHILRIYWDRSVSNAKRRFTLLRRWRG
jgi:hypothetical protein